MIYTIYKYITNDCKTYHCIIKQGSSGSHLGKFLYNVLVVSRKNNLSHMAKGSGFRMKNENDKLIIKAKNEDLKKG